MNFSMASTISYRPVNLSSPAGDTIDEMENITGKIKSPENDFAWVKQMEMVVSIVVPILFAIIVFVGFVGNLLVVLVVTFNKQMRNTTNLLIMNLAVADILFIIFCVPFSATAYAFPHNWRFGDIG